MSEPKHTPGPWRQRDDPADWLIEGADGALLAKAYTNVMAAGANAQLIAAAPELAEALETLLDWADAPVHMPERDAALVLARDTLKKAGLR